MASKPLPDLIHRSVSRGKYLFNDTKSLSDSQLSVAFAGWEVCDPEYNLERKGFHYHALEYIAGGEWELESKAQKYRLTPGSIFTYGPGVHYQLKAISETGLKKYFIDLRGPNIKQLLKKCGLSFAKPRYLKQSRWICDLLDQIIDTAEYPKKVQNTLSGMLVGLLFERIPQDLASAQMPQPNNATYDRCRQYLTDNYLEINNFAEAAKHCGVSSVHLSRLFQRFANESPSAFVTQLKMNHAAERITRAKLPIKAVAQELGFDDPYHFSRVFKKVHGVAPSKFRKKQ